MTFKSNLMGTGTPGAQAGAITGGALVGQTATGSTVADAFALSTSHTQFTTTASGTGAILPSFMQVGDDCSVYNNGANALLVYPLTGAKINNGATDAGFSVAANKSAHFVMLSSTLFGANLSA
jgi:hypothetical protein